MNYRLKRLKHVKLWIGAIAAGALWTLPAGAQAPRPNQPRAGVGPADRMVVDPAAATRGRGVWASECITCHGAQARGSDTAPSLLRSLVVLKDRQGKELGPFLKKGHPTQSGTPSASLTDAQIVDLAHFLRQRIEDTFRGSDAFTEGDILVGDAAAGGVYFNGGGQCATCHTATALSLDGIGTRLGPVELQQRMLFPGGRGGRGRGGAGATDVTVTLTPASGAAKSGTLVDMDDLFVTLKDESGATHVVRRVPGLKIAKRDPLQAHHDLLDRITDTQMHDLVAYLEKMK